MKKLIVVGLFWLPVLSLLTLMWWANPPFWSQPEGVVAYGKVAVVIYGLFGLCGTIRTFRY